MSHSSAVIHLYLSCTENCNLSALSIYSPLDLESNSERATENIPKMIEKLECAQPPYHIPIFQSFSVYTVDTGKLWKFQS